MELNAEQIKKALECCLANDICDSKCGECQYKSTGADCMDGMLRDALALITSQEQRIKELEAECKKWQSRLKIECEYTKADTVRKMQERLCEGRVSNDPVVIATNVVAKEMLEGNYK